VRVGLLGAVTAGPDGAPAPGGVRLRGALVRLALDAGRTVSKDVLVDALWGAHAVAGGEPLAAAALLGIAAGQRGAYDLGDPEVRATLDGVRIALGSDAALDDARALPRADALSLLRNYVRGFGAASGPGTVAGSDPTPAAASGAALDSASATNRV